MVKLPYLVLTHGRPCGRYAIREQEGEQIYHLSNTDKQIDLTQPLNWLIDWLTDRHSMSESVRNSDPICDMIKSRWKKPHWSIPRHRQWSALKRLDALRAIEMDETPWAQRHFRSHEGHQQCIREGPGAVNHWLWCWGDCRVTRWLSSSIAEWCPGFLRARRLTLWLDEITMSKQWECHAPIAHSLECKRNSKRQFLVGRR